MRALLLLALLCASGCAAEIAEPTLELGTGTWRFEPLEDGQSVPMIMGAQGGWHVWISVRAHDLDAGAGSLTIELSPADESAPPQTTSVGIQFDPPDDEGGRNYLGWPAILPDPACAVGELLRVHASLLTSGGVRLEDERYLIPGAGESPPPPCGE